MTVVEALVREAVEAIRIDSDTSFAWFGERFEPRAGEGLARALQRRLYSDFYCPGAATPHAGPEEPLASVRETGFRILLSAANGGTGAWEAGWRLHGRDGDALVVERDGLRVWAEASEVRRRPGEDAVTVFRGKEQLAVAPGFYVALGDAQPRDGDGHVVRFYLNVSRLGAVELVGALTRRLNGAGMPFRLKVVDDPRCFTRCDAAVLYVADADRQAAEAHVLGVASHLARPLLPLVPALTLRLGPGVGFAEDPGGEESFGMSRCRLIAEGVLRARDAGPGTTSARLARVAERFEQEGLDLMRPHQAARRAAPEPSGLAAR